METGTTERLLQLGVRNSAHMILAHRRVCHTCLGTHLRHLRFQSPAHYSAERWRTALEKSSWAVPTLWPKCPGPNLLPIWSSHKGPGHVSARPEPFEKKNFCCNNPGCPVRILTKSHQQKWTRENIEMALTREWCTLDPWLYGAFHLVSSLRCPWQSLSKIWAIWEKKFQLQQSWMAFPNFD